MRAIVSGSHGCVAPFVIEELQSRNIEVVIFDRTKTDITDYQQVYNFIKQSRADIFFHIATGDLKWLQYIVDSARQLNTKVVYTSSVSVFSEQSSGPYTVDSLPNATDDYGKYKREGEQIAAQYDNCLIARLGWQIGYTENSNNMLDFLIKQHRQKGYIEASDLWYPSCSFLKDTAKTLVDLAMDKTGLYQLNSNDKYTFYQIVNGLNKQFGMNWDVRKVNSFGRDDRMIDTRVNIAKLNF